MMDEHKPQNRPFLAEVAGIVLTLLAVTEMLSLLGLNPAFIAHLPHSFTLVLQVVILISSLIGIYGVVKLFEPGIYFALFAAVTEAIWGGYYAVQPSAFSDLNLAFTIQALISMFLGVIVYVCIFNTVPLPERHQPALSDSNSPSTMPSYAPSGHHSAIEVENLVKEYVLGPVVVHALNGLSLKIVKGEFVAIMGPSGSGKSTLMNLIGALDRPSSGRVLIDGIDIATLDDVGLAKLRNEKIGFVFQAYNLIARSSVLRNMELPALVQGYSKVERDQRIAKLLTIVGLPDKTHRKPKTMSGGEQQRVGIARALINNPSIILADEPTGNIDSKTGSEIMRFLRQMNVEQSVTVVMVTHDREVAELTDRIIYLRDGKITDEVGSSQYENKA